MEAEEATMEGTFKNGDEWTGYTHEEEGIRWYAAVGSDGREYETDEMPTRKPLFTLTQFAGTWTGDEVRAFWARESESK